MLNFNGKFVENNHKILSASNRALLYGDAVFEEMRCVNGHVHFLEEHYLRLMASMRILRMEIPMAFTMEFMEQQILKSLSNEEISNAHKVTFLVYREYGEALKPTTNLVSYLIKASKIESPFFVFEEKSYEIELFKDFYKSSNLLATLHTTNCMLHTVASIYAEENNYQDCLLLNERKNVVASIYGNIFLVKGSKLTTPPLTDGCLNSVLRKKVIEIVSKLEKYELAEASISPFELQKADEIFVVNTISGITPVTKYRKKKYTSTTAKELVGKVNALSRLELG